MPDVETYKDRVTPGRYTTVRRGPSRRDVVAKIAGPSTRSGSGYQAVDYEVITTSEVSVGEPRKNADLVLAAFELADALRGADEDPADVIRQAATKAKSA